MDNLSLTNTLPPVGTLIEQANALEASLGTSGYGGLRLRLPFPSVPQAFGATNLASPPSPCNHHGCFSTDVLDQHSQPFHPKLIESLRRFSASRSRDSARVLMTPPRSPSNVKENGHGLFRLSKESNASIDGKERLKRLKHTRKEQDRRKKNKAETDRLRGRVPECSSQTSKAEVLARANDYINNLEQQLREAIDRLRAMEGHPPGAE
ncbi:hypothetical protein GP486_000373 [Trichoglossum hirsutum]|uniref:BHLH domain-containing protein n=1 Tax=Trichoglossum hirsutum TaxID=265104 RepID=A0A9P8LIP7_9PEZI|nr:hypothetical protein GP486_000373 [Trichoglossum hirsutum]